MSLRPIQSSWVATAANILEECTILGFRDVSDLYAFLAEDTQWNAFQLYHENRISVGGGPSHTDVMKEAVEELRSPSAKHDSENLNTVEWRVKDWKVHYITTVIDENHYGKWADIRDDQIPELVHGVLSLLVFMQDAAARKGSAFVEIMKARGEIATPSPVNQVQALASASSSQGTSRISKLKYNGPVTLSPVNRFQGSSSAPLSRERSSSQNLKPRNMRRASSPLKEKQASKLEVESRQSTPPLFHLHTDLWKLLALVLKIIILIFALYGVWMMFNPSLSAFADILCDKIRALCYGILDRLEDGKKPAEVEDPF